MKLLESWGNIWMDETYLALSPGPYFYKDNALWQVMRLYDDHQGAFLVSTKSGNGKDSTYDILNDGKHGW